MAAPVLTSNFTQAADDAAYTGSVAGAAATWPGTAPTLSAGAANVDYTKNDGSTVGYNEFVAAANRVGSVRVTANMNVPTDGLVYLTYSTATESGSTALLATIANHGFSVVLGSASGYRRWVIGGKDQNDDPGPRQVVAVLDPRATATAAENSGSFDPTAITYTQFMARQETTGENHLVGIRHLGFFSAPPRLTEGDVTTPGTWARFADAIRDVYTDANRLLELVCPRSLGAQFGFLIPVQIGNGGSTAVRFVDRNVQVAFAGRMTAAATPSIAGDCRLHSDANKLGLTLNISSNFYCEMSSCQFASATPWRLTITPNGNTSQTAKFDGCVFVNAGSISIAPPFRARGSVWSQCARFAPGTCDLDGATITQSAATDGAVDMAAGATLTGISFVNNTFAIRIAAAGTYTLNGVNFSGSTTADINVTATTGTVTINVQGGGNTPTYTSAGATVVVQNTVPVTLTNVQVGSRYRVERADNGALLFEGTAASSTVSLSHSYTADLAVVIKVRKSSAAPRFQPYDTQGTITTSGLTVFINQIADAVAA